LIRILKKAGVHLHTGFFSGFPFALKISEVTPIKDAASVR
jgi:hypothetical protein